MANTDHLNWLGNVNYWNEVRRELDFTPELFGAKLRSAYLVRANLETALLHNALLQRADLRQANLRLADLTDASLWEADLRGAALTGAVFENAYIRDADVTTIMHQTDNIYTRTDLSGCVGLSQEQVNSLKGDNGTILPENLRTPEHWPHLGENFDRSINFQSKQVSGIDGTILKIRSRTISEIRESLLKSYTEPAALSQYMVEQLQKQIADHEMTVKPNEEIALNAWHSDGNLLREMLITVQVLSSELPLSPQPKLSDKKLTIVRSALLDLANKIEQAISFLDNDTGTYGNFWKIGLIGAATNLLMAFGITMPVATPVAAGVIGINSFRVMVSKGKS